MSLMQIICLHFSCTLSPSASFKRMEERACYSARPAGAHIHFVCHFRQEGPGASELALASVEQLSHVNVWKIHHI